MTNTYDAAGQPFSLYAAGSALVSGASYSALGQPRRIDFGNGLSQRRYYGGLDTTLYVQWGKMRQLCVAQTSLGECADDAAPGRGGTYTTLFNAVYGYDAAGNVTAVDERTPGHGDISHYLYDALDRLTDWRKVTSWSPYTATTQESYSYSAIGNLTGRYGVSATGAITYPAAGSARPHAATATANGNGYSYDANGNMTVRREMSGTQPFTYTQAWTIENRLAAITKTNGAGTNLAATTYTYDGDGTRVRKEDPDGITLYIGATEAIIGAPETVGIEYYDDTQAGTFSFLNYTKTVVSATTGISYAWGGAAPLAGMGDAPWALRWNAWVSVTQAGLYTVTVIADDGVGLSIAGVSVIYSLSIRDTGPLTAGVGVNLTPGNLYQLQVSYLNYTSTNGANFRLLWTRPDGVTEDIPASALRARSRRDYYSFGGAVVAMKEGVAKDARVLTYLHGDHLGSVSLATNAAGQKVSEQRYKPYGEVRWASGAGMPTDFTFTSQRAGPANYVGSLTDYVARFYSPALGRFVSADTIVPEAGNSQAYNRYSYVQNSPLGRIDPSGHEDCATDACWQSEWAWKNRWYEAHGWFWENAGWGRQDVANFRDSNVIKDTLAEMGAVFANGLGVGWTWREMSLVGQGLVTLANRLGGLLGFAQLKSLVGGSVRLERNDTALFERVAYTEWWFGGNKSIIHFQEPLFSQSDDYIRGTAVHEIAHIIDYQSAKGYGWFSTNLPAVDPKFLTNYARTEGGIEPFSELLSLWVFDSPAGNRYRNAIGEGPVEQDADIAKWLLVNLGVP